MRPRESIVYGGPIGAYFTANSDCPGFSDAVEGTYATQGSGYASFLLGSEKVTDHQAPVDCVPLTITFPDVSIPLLREEPTPVWMSLNLKGLTLRGALFSTGSESAQCLDTTCAPQRRDGGGGWCIGKNEPCAPGYHDDGGGQCVPDAP